MTRVSLAGLSSTQLQVLRACLLCDDLLLTKQPAFLQVQTRFHLGLLFRHWKVTDSQGDILSPCPAAAKSLQSCPTLWDPIDSSPPGSPVPGILQARTLEWGAIAFSAPCPSQSQTSQLPHWATLISQHWVPHHNNQPGHSRKSLPMD